MERDYIANIKLCNETIRAMMTVLLELQIAVINQSSGEISKLHNHSSDRGPTALESEHWNKLKQFFRS